MQNPSASVTRRLVGMVNMVPAPGSGGQPRWPRAEGDASILRPQLEPSMRRATLAAILLVLIGCKAPSAEPAKTPAPPAVDQVDVVDQYMAGWNADDAARDARSMTEDVTY